MYNWGFLWQLFVFLFYYKYNFFNILRVIQLFCFNLSELWQPKTFKEVVHSSKLLTCWEKLFIILYCFLFNICSICGNSISLIPDLGLCVSLIVSLIILARGLSMLLIFSKKQSLVPLIVSVIFLFH